MSEGPKRNAFFRHELRGILCALYMTNRAAFNQIALIDDPAYLQGYDAALQGVALALGLVDFPPRDAGVATMPTTQHSPGQPNLSVRRLQGG